MGSLYSGRPEDDWFLQAVMRSRESILPCSGVSFLQKIDAKIELASPDWNCRGPV
jgi:hypothetical protein